MKRNIEIESTYPPCLMKANGWTRIIAGTISKVNGKPWKHAYVAVKGESLSTANITWTRSKFPHMKPSAKKVQGSNGKVYTVTTMQSGVKTCTCEGFKYRRMCKHTQK